LNLADNGSVEGDMDSQRFVLALLAVLVLLSDAWQDVQFFAHASTQEGSLLASAAVRTLLLLLTIAALLRPQRGLVLLALIGLGLALVRRILYLGPLFHSELWAELYPVLHSGFDLAFRLALLVWGIHWLRTRS
jgi:hypothetical protein